MWQGFILEEIHVHRTGTPLSPGTDSLSATDERMTSDSSPGDVTSGLLLSFVVEGMIFITEVSIYECLFSLFFFLSQIGFSTHTF